MLDRQPLHIDDLNEEVTRIAGYWPSMPSVTVVKTNAEIPFEANPKARGIYHDGKVFIVASKIYSIDDLQKVMAHECTMHHTIFEMMDSYEFSKLHIGIQRMKERGDPVISSLAKKISLNYGKLSPEEETAEIIAHAGEKCLDQRGNVKIEYGFMKDVFAEVAGFLRDRGIPVRMTNFELQGIIHRAGKRVRQEPVMNAEGFKQRIERVVRPQQFMSISKIADENGIYAGKILDVQGNKVIQKTGPGNTDYVIHELKKFAQVPLIGEYMKVKYANGKVQVDQTNATGLGGPHR